MYFFLKCFKVKILPTKRIEKAYYTTLKIMTLDMLKNKELKIGRKLDIKVSYKTLWLKIAKHVVNFCTLPYFQHVFIM